MSRQLEEEAARKAKLARFVEEGIDPFPDGFDRTHTLGALAPLSQAIMKTQASVRVAGRIRSFRTHGGLTFATLEDASGRMQVAFRRDALGDDRYRFWTTTLDVGDFLGVAGTLFTTKRGEMTVDVARPTLLAKALLPLPEKWHGLTDVEVRYRKRYLDLIANPEVRAVFLKRSRIVREIRAFLDAEGFLEVETPVLQPISGGAAAKPFVTRSNALDQDLFLRIAPELYLKRLIVGGFEKVYEMARCFRNEGIDHAHNPEFTQVEFYWAYADYEALMALTERMLGALLVAVNGGSLTLVHEGTKLDFTPPIRRITFRDLLKDRTGIDINLADTEAKLRTEIRDRNLHVDLAEAKGYAETVEALYKARCRESIVEPTFLIDYPAAMIPLAKRRKDDPSKIATFQLIAKGMELCKAYNELNDPVDQARRFDEQDELRSRGAAEAQETDADFIEALSYGMPPTAGFGMGIDRLTVLLTGVHSIKETILFPTLRSVTAARPTRPRRSPSKKRA